MLQSHKVAQESALVLATDIIFHNRLWKFLSFLFNSKSVSMVKIVCSIQKLYSLIWQNFEFFWKYCYVAEQRR